jgi:ribosomal RNA-processing protein 9
MLYVETLYGHQFGVTDIDCHRQELPVSVGRDRTARAWKLSEDSHLIFRGGAKVASAEAVSVLHDDWFLTGHEDGHLALWMTAKKRPVASIDHAHGLRTASDQGASADSFIGNGITSLAALKNSDVAATGSNDGYLRLWKVRGECRS